MFAETPCAILTLRRGASGSATAPGIGRRMNFVAAPVCVPAMPFEVGFVRAPRAGLYRSIGY
jgi:hypothetical protein